MAWPVSRAVTGTSTLLSMQSICASVRCQAHAAHFFPGDGQSWRCQLADKLYVHGARNAAEVGEHEAEAQMDSESYPVNPSMASALMHESSAVLSLCAAPTDPPTLLVRCCLRLLLRRRAPPLPRRRRSSRRWRCAAGSELARGGNQTRGIGQTRIAHPSGKLGPGD
eukprot:6194649-Pleurochrysis_carterae.AAC.8